MGPNMSSPERRDGSGDPPIKPLPTNEDNLSQNASNSSSSKLINPEESTRLFDRLTELSEPPTRSSYCDPSQVNLLVSLLENGDPAVDLTSLFFAGKYPLNTLIDRPKKNGDLVVSLLLPQDFPSSREKLVDWTRGILRERFPLGITSILSAGQAKDIFDLIHSTHYHPTRDEESQEKENSVVFFDCEASWEPDPTRVDCVVYKIQHQARQIAVLRVNEASEEHKQLFDCNRVGFAKGIIIPLLLCLRIFTFKFIEKDFEAMENQNGAWWLPIVAERARRARERRAAGGGHQTQRTPVEDYRVFGSTSQSWLGGYEASTFQPSTYQPQQHEPSGTSLSATDTTADTSSTPQTQPTTQAQSTPQTQGSTESTRASRKATKKKAKKKAKKEAKKAELESSSHQEGNLTVSTAPAEEHLSLDQNTAPEYPTREAGGEPTICRDSSKLTTEETSPTSPRIDVTADTSQKEASTIPFQQIDEQSSPKPGSVGKVLSSETNTKLEATETSTTKPTKTPIDEPVSTSSPTVSTTANITPKVSKHTGSGTSDLKSASSKKALPQVLSIQDSSPNTTSPKASTDTTIKSAGKRLTETSISPHTSTHVKQESTPITAPSIKGDSSNFSAPNPSTKVTTGSVKEDPAQPSSKKKKKRNKKGSSKPKNESQAKVEPSEMPKSTAVASGSASENLTADTNLVTSKHFDDSSQTKQALAHGPMQQSSTPPSKSSKARQTPPENTLSLDTSSQVEQKPTSVGKKNEPSSALSSKSSGNTKSTSARELTETPSSSSDKPSKVKQTQIMADKPAGTSSSSSTSLNKPSQSKQISTLTSSSSTGPANKPSPKLKENRDVKSTYAEPSSFEKNESAKSSPFTERPVSNNSITAEKEQSSSSSSQISHSPSEQIDQELLSKSGVQEQLEEDENKPKTSKKQSKKRRGRSKKGRSNSTGDKAGEESGLKTSETSIRNNTQSSTSDATPRNESSPSKSDASLDNKPSIASIPASTDRPKFKATQDSKVTAFDPAMSQSSSQRTGIFRNIAGNAPSVNQMKNGSSKQTPIVPEKIGQSASVSSAGIGNQTLVKAPEKSVEEAKRASQAGPAQNTKREAPVASSASNTRSNLTATNAPSSNPGTQGRQASQGFFWQLDSHGFPCAMASCDKRCNSWDGASVICPKCGPYSEIRYCGKEHLFEDVKYHWLDCGTKTFKHPCKASTIPREQKEGPPLLPSLHNWDTPERFRQAVRHAADKSGDYFVFQDRQDWIAAGQPTNNVAVRCSTTVIHTVKFDDPEEKDRFRRLLGIALFNSLQSFELVGYLFRLIRGNALAKGQWSEELDLALRYQFNLEYGFAVDPWLGARHACETEWTGANFRHCSDAVCRAERVQLLGDRGVGRGFQHLCAYLEASHWLLRAARRTHPSVAAVEERMRGEGFEGVVPEDRRVFRRGEGWDGFGSGDMEIEGVNLF